MTKRCSTAVQNVMGVQGYHLNGENLLLFCRKEAVFDSDSSLAGAFEAELPVQLVLEHILNKATVGHCFAAVVLQ